MDIAIIGMSGRFPEAPDLASFYRHLKNGRDSVRPLTLARMRSTSLPPVRSYKHFAYLDDIDRFDYRFFGILYSEAIAMAPQQRIMLEMVHETVERAGYAPGDLKGTRTAVFIASNAPDYYKLAPEFSPSLLTGNLAACISGWIARYFNWTGAAIQVDTACSSSLVALHLACQELEAGHAEMAVCGGINLVLFPAVEGTDAETGITSPTAKCRTFSAAADGAGMGEGGACVLLKPLDKAITDRDNILAVIKGSAVNQDAHRSSTLTAPSSIAQAEVITLALQKAGVDPVTITHIEAHGTGTRLGDPIEIEGLSMAFEQYTSRKQFCAISALKSNIGHTDAAAGLLGIIKTLISLEKKELFPSLHINAVNPMIDFMHSPLYPNIRWQPWESEHERRRAGVSAFGISGTNCHVILEEWKAAPVPVSSGTPYLFCISAPDPVALRRNCLALQKFVAANRELPLQRISYTLNTGRQLFDYRVAIVAATHEGLLAQLANISIPEDPVPPAPDTWFLFTASERQGMQLGNDLAHAFPAYAAGYHEAMQQLAGADEADLFSIAAGHGSYKLFEALGIPVKQVMGLGIGKEISALVSGRKTWTDIAASVSKGTDYTIAAPKWDDFVQTRLKDKPALVWETGIGASHHKALQAYRTAASAFEAVNPAANFSFRELLQFIGELTLRGYTLNMKALYAEPQIKAALPPYQFESLRCWLRSVEDNPVSNWVHQLEWALLPEQDKTTVPAPAVYVYAANEQAGALLSAALRRQGRQVTGVYPGERFELLHNGDLRFNWLDEEQYGQFAALLSSGHGAVLHIHLGGCFQQHTHIEDSFNDGLYAVMLLAKTLDNLQRKQELVIVTQQAVEVTGRERTVNAAGAALHGLVAGIKADMPGLQVRAIDTEAEGPLPENTEALAAALNIHTEQAVTALRAARLYGRKTGKPVKGKAIHLQSNSVYLITGGASGIGLQALKALSYSQATFIVTGRRQFPHPAFWPFVTAEAHPAHYEAVQGFLQAIKNGSRVIYFAADVADRKQMQAVFDRVHAEYGPVRGIIHAAGVGGKSRIQRHTIESFRETLLPKIQGSLLLRELAGREKLSFFLLFSSHNTFTAAERESNYSAANAFLDSFAAVLNREGIHGMTIRWPFWSETGMGHRMKPYDNFRIPPEISVTNEEGIAVFDYLLQQGYTDVLIAKADPLLARGTRFSTTDGYIDAAPAVPAQNIPMEERLLQIWRKILSREQIGPGDNFFQLGGHSLLGLQIRNQIEKQLRLKLEYRDIVECPTIQSLAARLRSLGHPANRVTGITAAPEQERYPLSQAQQGLWIACQTEGNKSLYNVNLGYRISATVNVPALRSAIGCLMQRHEILRTGFFYRDEELYQSVLPPDAITPPLTLLEDAARALDIVEGHVFDLSAAPLFRIWLVKREAAHYELLISIHHLVVDGWSAHLFLHELFHVYGLYLQDTPPLLTLSTLQYRDYAVWEKQQLSGAAYTGHQRFWQQYLQALPPALQLPVDYERRAARRGKGDCLRFELTAAHLEGFGQICRQEGVSKFLVGYSMLQLLLYRYTGQPDFFIGTPSSLRNDAALEGQLGYYVNMLPLRCQVSGSDTFYTLLRRSGQLLKSVQDHQVYPFHLIVKAAPGMVTAPGRHPLFDIVFSYEHQPSAKLSQALDGAIREMDLYTVSSKYDIEFIMKEADGKIAVSIMYDTDLYTSSSIRLIADHFIRLSDMITLNLSIDRFIFEDRAPVAPQAPLMAMDFNF